jgi:hypothetical protein
MDFVTVQQPDGSWHCPAIEVNLRWGGTTHPAATLRLLTHGHLEPETGLYTADKGVPKFYCAAMSVAVVVPHPAIKRCVWLSNQAWWGW